MPGLFNAVRGSLGLAGGSASKYGLRNAFAGGVRGIGGMAAAGAGDVLRYGSTMSNLGLSTAGGAIAGGAYGAMSDNTSVLGGAIMGAGLGAGAIGARRGAANYGLFRAYGFGRGKSAFLTLNSAGAGARNFIGDTSRRAYNSFRGLHR